MVAFARLGALARVTYTSKSSSHQFGHPNNVKHQKASVMKRVSAYARVWGFRV
jgi:hypothetical protein